VEEEFSSQNKPNRNPFTHIQQEIDDFDKKLESSSIEDLEKELASITKSFLPKDFLDEEVKSLENQELPFNQTMTQKEQTSLIDDFLNTFNKTSEVIEPSNITQDQTEEEAIRLFDEGNVQAAIAIYEQLKFKFPEKSAYYQSQIDIFSMDFANLSISDLPNIVDIDFALADNTPQEELDISNLTKDFLGTPTLEPAEEEVPCGLEKTSYQEEILSFEETTFTENNETSEGLESVLEENSNLELLENNTISGNEVTESQAITYFNNGNIEKAVEIYRQLILQNPEKRAYFASQIEVLES